MQNKRGTVVSNSWRVVRRLVALLAMSTIALFWTGCYPSHPQSTFDALGPIAQIQLDLFLIIFWAAVFVFVVVIGVLLYVIIKYRRKPGQDMPVQVHGNRRLEIAWTIAPAIVLAVIAVPTVTAIFETANTPAGEVVKVEVTGHQWWWEFEYPELGVVTANELHVPVGKVIDLTLESDDVIHSFWVPKLFGKTDLVPNNINTMWFKADQAGTYLGQCGEFCGIAHAQMKFSVIADQPEDFAAWVENQRAGPAVPMAPVFGLKGCAVCHTFSGPEAKGIQQTRMNAFLNGEPRYPAPNLTHFASREVIAAGVLENTSDNLSLWLEDPGKVKPGNHMAALAGAYTDDKLRLSSGDISALVAYLQSLK